MSEEDPFADAGDDVTSGAPPTSAAVEEEAGGDSGKISSRSSSKKDMTPEERAARRRRKEAKRKKKAEDKKKREIIVSKEASAYGHFQSAQVEPSKKMSTLHTTEYIAPEMSRFFDAQVDDPVKHGDGFSAYTTYRVRVKASDPEFSPMVDIRLRYSDFHNLRTQLVEAHPTMLVPALPPKQIFGRFNPKFVEKRALGLTKFLNLVVSHAVFGKSAHLTDMFKLSR